ncbi:copper amine oxidase N-terminal domain-containing protein, partial [Alkaliphilus transvaalensis]|uniref:copper amine oxidase N-terminal domain-containing protein n=1 Tax=Alkaliphilus transvaalensis TaxID=114628 RepID=UPI00047E972B
MKRKLSVLMIVVMLLTLMSSTALGWGPIRVVLSGELMRFPDAQPFLDNNGRTQVPIRFISEALGAEVDWNPSSQMVTIKRDGDIITLKIGEKSIEKNQE